jgi:hypothetical protein
MLFVALSSPVVGPPRQRETGQLFDKYDCMARQLKGETPCKADGAWDFAEIMERPSEGFPIEAPQISAAVSLPAGSELPTIRASVARAAAMKAWRASSADL